MAAAAAAKGFVHDGGCCAFFAPSAAGIVPPRHVGKMWGVMIFRDPEQEGQYANVIAWGKAQGPLWAKLLDAGDYENVLAQGRRLVAARRASGYVESYAAMRAEFGAGPEARRDAVGLGSTGPGVCAVKGQGQ
jgi:hypothetical protein